MNTSILFLLFSLLIVVQSLSGLESLKGNYSEFSGKVAFVTGGSSGMGFSASLNLAQLGSHVVFICRDHHPTWYNGSWAQNYINSNQLVQQANGSALFVQADFTDINQVRNAINIAHSTYGRIDYFANLGGNAGWVKRTDEILQDYINSTEDAIKNNLYGNLNLLRAQTRYILDNGDPDTTYTIVLMSSYDGIRGCENCSMYAASKWGINALAQSAALEFLQTKPRIRINSVAAGLPSTSLTWQQAKYLEWEKQVWEEPYVTPDSDLWKKWEPTFTNSLVGKRIADVQEITNVVVYLLSKSSDHINGQVITLDNAQSAL